MSRQESPPDRFLAEIAGQPDALRRAAEAITDARDVLRSLQEAARVAKLIVFTGMGASYHACYPAISELAASGVPGLLVDTAELLHFRMPLLDEAALVVMVSQSGESAEAVQLATRLSTRGPHAFVVSITNGVANPLAGGADLALDTRAGEERGPSTMTFGGALVTLFAVAGVLAGADPTEAVDRTQEAAHAAADRMKELLRTPETWAGELSGWRGERSTLVLLGRGPARAASEMGALLLKESAGIAAEALEAAQFRHGPLELAGPDLAAIVVATEPETAHLDIGLAADLLRTGSAVLVVTVEGEVPKEAHAVDIGSLHRAVAPAVAVVPVQLLAWRLALDRGRMPGVLTRATKVTTRE
jgi:glucosamine--fructose-6-phosphate aminotransferase (isomerizing)